MESCMVLGLSCSPLSCRARAVGGVVMVGSLVLGLSFAIVLRLCSREGVEAWVDLPLVGWFGSPCPSQSR